MVHLRDLAFRQHNLQGLIDQTAEMAGLVESNFSDLTVALRRLDMDLCARIITADGEINQLEAKVQSLATESLRRHASSDAALREIMAIVRIASNLEQIGDLIKGIARRMQRLLASSTYPKEVLPGIVHLCEITLLQTQNAIDAFLSRDLERASQVLDRDDEIDSLYMALFKGLLSQMAEDPSTVNSGAYLLFCAKNMERIGDHGSDIASCLKTYLK